jgi:hypothetical protein
LGLSGTEVKKMLDLHAAERSEATPAAAGDDQGEEQAAAAHAA